MEKLSVYIDFDRTIAPNHGFTEPPNPKVVESIQKLRTKYNIVIFSTRANKEICNECSYLELLDYLHLHNVPYDQVCDNKPLFVAMIDDRTFNPQKESWDSIVDSLMTL